MEDVIGFKAAVCRFNYQQCLFLFMLDYFKSDWKKRLK